MNTLERAMAALDAGRPLDAEAIVTDAVRDAAKADGENSAGVAAAEFERAQVLFRIGDYARGAAALRRAADIPSRDRPSERDRLTYLMNLGHALHRLGELDEAHAVLLRGLRDREVFYGKDSEGHAFGQEALADVLLALGKLDEAEALVEFAFRTLWDAGNGRALPVAALRAAVRMARHGDDVPLLEPYRELPRELKVELVRACLYRSEVDHPRTVVGVLVELRERIEDDPEGPADWLVQVNGAIAGAARFADDAEARIAALKWLLAHYDATGETRQAANVVLGIALARDDDDDADGAAREYQEATRRAEAVGDAALRSKVRRNVGLFLSQRGRKDEAGELLADAVTIAEPSGDNEALGQALIAHGVHVQHAEKLEDARRMLERALTLLPPSHPDTLYARSHLDAIAQKRSCGCGDMRAAFGQALEAMVRDQLPDGLLRSVTVESVENLALRIDLAREPAADEKVLLDRVMNQAVVRLRERIRQHGQL